MDPDAHEELAEAPPAALRVEGLTKAYDDFVAVDGVSFEARAGEVLGLVGPNGAGKTTTLRSIAGVLPVDPGHVLVCGHDVAVEERAAKRCLAWVPDDPQPFDALTVAEHLQFVASLFEVPDWEPRAEELLERFELTEKRGALGGELSRGMRQKLAFCQAWLPRPRLLLMDEPLSGLDPRGIRVAKDAIRALADEGTAVILSSHLLGLIEALGDRIVILDGGRVRFDGTIESAREGLAVEPGSSLEEVFFAATERAEG